MSPNFAPGLETFIERATKVLPDEYHLLPIPEQRELYRGLTTAFPIPWPETVTAVDDAVKVYARFARFEASGA